MSTSVPSGIIEEARERCNQLIAQGFENERPVLIDALPAIGKSRGLVEWAAETGKPLTVFTARHELYKQYLDWAEKLGMSSERVKRLPSFHRDCPTVHSEVLEHADLRERVLREYNRGISGVELHLRAEKLFGEELPCNVDSSCPYLLGQDYDADDYDLLVGHYTHAYTKDPINGRYVAFDEFPEDDFLIELDSSTAKRAISNYVVGRPSFPFKNYKQAEKRLRNRSKGQTYSDAAEYWLNDKEPLENWRVYGRPERQESLENIAPVLFRIQFFGEELDNDWEYKDLEYGRVGVLDPEDGSISILIPPFLREAHGVIGLDGTPTVEKWRLLFSGSMDYWPVHDDRERREYLRDGLGLRIIQTTEDTKPYLNRYGYKVSEEEDLTLIEAIIDREGEIPAIISSKKAIEKYRNAGLDMLLVDPEQQTEHYLNLKGSNKFQATRLGVIVGCPQFGDDVYQKWGALSKRSVERKFKNGQPTAGRNLDFGTFGNRLLAGMRDNEVLQAAMRFGRIEKDGERGATVYIHTAAIPGWVKPERNIVSIRTWDSGPKEGLKKVVEGIEQIPDWNRNEWFASDVKAEIDLLYNKADEQLSIQTVRTHLNNLESAGLIGSRGERPKIWHNIALDQRGKYGCVIFEH